MLFQLFLSASVSVLLLISPVTEAVCTKPAVRKEWRTLSVAERTEWIDAVKVSWFGVQYDLSDLREPVYGEFASRRGANADSRSIYI
jgi:hypothetical protein